MLERFRELQKQHERVDRNIHYLLEDLSRRFGWSEIPGGVSYEYQVGKIESTVIMYDGNFSYDVGTFYTIYGAINHAVIEYLDIWEAKLKMKKENFSDSYDSITGNDW